MEGLTAGGALGRSETGSGAGASGFSGTAAAGAASMSSYRSRLRRVSYIPGIDTKTHDREWQCRGASTWTRRRPTTNENELPAYADELSSISTIK
jgi:hypothetical protein